MMQATIWLTSQIVLAIHDEQLSQFGGAEGLRDSGLLDSALARPINRLHYDSKATIFDLAAALGAGIIANHPFVDGNKRTGLLSIHAFLYLNGWIFDPLQEDEVRIILSLAAGEMKEGELAEWIKASSAKESGR